MQDLRTDHLGRMRPAREPGQGSCAGRPVVSRASRGRAHQRRLPQSHPRPGL